MIAGTIATPGPTAKRAVASCVRMAHTVLLAKPMPRKVAIYFHDLEPSHWPSFREAIGYFLEQGYELATASEFAADDSSRKRLFVSFDDNFASWHAALGLMDKIGLKATFYVNTLPFRDTCDSAAIAGFFERIAHKGEQRTLTRAGVAEISSAGHSIGCHSHSHFNLAATAPPLWDAEIRQSKEILQDIVNREVDAFSYPYGMRRFFTGPLRHYCESIGFRTIATGIPGLQQQRRIDPLALHRTRWNLSQSLARNLADIQIDGAIFERLTGKSAVG